MGSTWELSRVDSKSNKRCRFDIIISPIKDTAAGIVKRMETQALSTPCDTLEGGRETIFVNELPPQEGNE